MFGLQVAVVVVAVDARPVMAGSGPQVAGPEGRLVVNHYVYGRNCCYSLAGGMPRDARHEA